jgi:hypothetical protein
MNKPLNTTRVILLLQFPLYIVVVIYLIYYELCCLIENLFMENKLINVPTFMLFLKPLDKCIKYI